MEFKTCTMCGKTINCEVAMFKASLGNSSYKALRNEAAGAFLNIPFNCLPYWREGF